jgi:hypothetical protein
MSNSLEEKKVGLKIGEFITSSNFKSLQPVLVLLTHKGVFFSTLYIHN